MPGRWNNKKLDSLKRDLLRDYCLISASLQEQFARFDASGALSFAIIAEGIGGSYSKGLLWEVKDTAHHLFRDKSRLCPAGCLLDWTIGFLFHECMQVMETAYQLQYYAPRLSETPETTEAALQNQFGQTAPLAPTDPADPKGRAEPVTPADMAHISRRLGRLAGATREELGHHIARARQLLETANELFCLYLAGASDNRPLARLLHDRDPLVRQVFGPFFEKLTQGIYGQEPEKAFIEAALSLAETGHTQKALQAALKARELAPDNAETARLILTLDPS
ncbi:MAG: hypothetical protein LBV80_07595 [Deltaproteobacteria bacterium]|jgi:hypothetical protein|nr:hypothetical protein [Deltaproteobacteria bacterium]